VPAPTPQYICYTKVKADSRDAFERHVADVVLPAVAKARPAVVDEWSLMRPTGADADGTLTYVMLFYGQHDMAEWDLGPVFNDALGEEQGATALETFNSLIDSQHIDAFTSIT
jgi:hypothetical protein